MVTLSARRPAIAFMAAIVAASWSGAGRVRAQDHGVEDRLKAAVVSKLPQFVDWPATSLTGRQALDVCVAAPAAFGVDLRALVAGESVKGRPLVVRDVRSDAQIDACHVLFMPAAPKGERRALLSRASSRPILTVGDDPEFLKEGGIVDLRLVDGRMRFDINVEAARQSGLRISSQLLQLAASVKGHP